MYERFDKREAVTKGEFSFLIAFARQLDRALELGEDAPDFIHDALGRLAHALDGLTGTPVDAEEDGGGTDDGGDIDDDSPPWVEPTVADRGPGARARARALGGAVAGLKPATDRVNLKKVPTLGTESKKSNGKKSKKSRR